MQFQDIFELYYAQYRAEATQPTSADDEYTIAMRLANVAIRRWFTYDATYWQGLFTTLRASGEGTTIATGESQYDAPEDMQEAGAVDLHNSAGNDETGWVKVLNSAGRTVVSYPIIDVREAQIRNDGGRYAYFTGDPNNGFTLNLNPAPDSSINGLEFDYTYYKKPTLVESADSTPEMSDPLFIVNHMLANRLRTSRNPYYGSAHDEAENLLGVMKMKNDSGTWSNPITARDRSGSIFGG